ncbi:DUF2029 domain-containing protein [Patescibacteria group bacterium]|nr:DUF2029 domain-containing protein [Patescibacteria group bacterium]
MKNWLTLNKINLCFLTFVVFIIIFLQATIPLWHNHLIVDVWFYFERAKHFFTYRTLSNLVGNEHLPGALFYFFIPSPVLLIEKSLEIYTQAFFLLGFIFLLAHIFIYKKISGYFGILIFLLILLFTGPILLFRFELAVSLLVLLSIYFFKKEKISWSSLFLGIATTIKIYPVLILPYYLIIFFKKKQYKKLLNSLGYFFLGLGIVVGSYFLIGGSIKELSGSFRFHALKPLGLESPITSVILLSFKNYYHRLPAIFGAYGVWGIDIDFLPVDLNFFNILPVAIVFLVYIFVFYSKRLYKEFKTSVIFLIFLFFLIFSKNMNPQYLFWAFSLVPILEVGEKRRQKSSFLLVLVVVLITALLTQYIYPILYTDLISSFRESSKFFTPVVYFLFLRNFLVLVLLIVSGYEFLPKKGFK